MKKNFALILLLLLFALGCEKQSTILDIVEEENIVTPFLTLSFDSPPSMKELIEIGKAKLSTSSKDFPNTAWQYPDANNEKLIILTVHTADYTNAGTDHAANCSFIGRWINNYSIYQTYGFILDNTSRDDLNRNSYNVFYYFIDNWSNSSDQFISGRLKNTATDGWLCDYVSFEDISCSGTRGVTLHWGDPNLDWVQSDGNILSSEKNSNITSWLYYTNCSN